MCVFVYFVTQETINGVAIGNGDSHGNFYVEGINCLPWASQSDKKTKTLTKMNGEDEGASGSMEWQYGVAVWMGGYLISYF